ncbi:MAG: hypothetical protein MK008_12590 [Bdellovibrionales bacterium]|nr:hypothetical protein [Bdellovibrionales bacterium]
MRGILCCLIVVFSLTGFSSAENTQFSFNKANINALSALICSLHTSLSADSGRADEALYFHKFYILNSYPASVSVQGLCQSLSWEAENNFEMKTVSKNKLKGQVDNYKFYVYFKNIKRVYNNKVQKLFVLEKITMFPSPSLLPDGLADFLEPSFEQISVQKIIPHKSTWKNNFNDQINFRSDEFNRSLLGFVMFEHQDHLFLDAVPTLNFHTGKYRKQKDRAQAVFINKNSNHMYGCSQFTDSTSSAYKITSDTCRSLRF